MEQDTTTVYGERIEDLLPALMKIMDSMHKNADGSYTMSGRFTDAEGTPLRRAMFRIEAELMLEDAEHLGTEDYIDRTYEQRAADALLLLAKTLAERAGTKAA